MGMIEGMTGKAGGKGVPGGGDSGENATSFMLIFEWRRAT